MPMELLDARDLPHFSLDTYVAEVDGSEARTLRTFYARVAKALHFPTHFGNNLDALFDCLCSLEKLGKPHVVLLVRHAGHFLEKEKKDKRDAGMKVLRDAEKPDNRYDGIKFKVIGVR